MQTRLTDILRQSETLRDLAWVIGVKYSFLTYVLYRMPDHRRYSVQFIKKKSGGYRKLTIPNNRLSQVQKKLSDMLYVCREEIRTKEKSVGASSYGFEKNKSIFDNARKHTKKNWVLNIDLENFFESITIGHVIGYLKKDRNLQLSHDVALAIGQIACHESHLPQGAPTSPILANMVCDVLDRRIRKLCNQERVSYSRYADDLTFSSNLKEVPEAIAYFDPNTQAWVCGHKLRKILNKSGFTPNLLKTRIEFNCNSQRVTGLTVNSNVHVPTKYRKLTRAMCHRLFSTGEYSIHIDGREVILKYPEISKLEGRVRHCANISIARRIAEAKVAQKEFDEKKFSSCEKLATDFSIYKNFLLSTIPVILTEGYTDYLYLSIARSVDSLIPTKLISSDKKPLFRILKPTFQLQRTLKIGNGATDFFRFIENFGSISSRLHKNPNRSPTIIIVDGDKAGNSVWKKYIAASGKISSDENCIKISDFLYLIRLRHFGNNSEIEDYFSKEIRQIKIDGRIFDPNKDSSRNTYSKIEFAKKVVPENASPENLQGFSLIFQSIEACISDFQKTTGAE